MMKDLQHRYCIVGVGNTAYGTTPGHSQLALNVMAIRAALEDAGLTTRDLDGVLTKAPTSTFPRRATVSRLDSSILPGSLGQGVKTTPATVRPASLAASSVSSV